MSVKVVLGSVESHAKMRDNELGWQIKGNFRFKSINEVTYEISRKGKSPFKVITIKATLN